MAELDRIVRAIPLWLLADYLRDAGGRATDRENGFAGDGWTATLTQVEDFTVGSLAVGQVRLLITGDDDAVGRLVRTLEPRMLRAGG